MTTEQARWPTYTVPPLAGKVAVVTGGAKGIGAAISSLLACDGADVVVVGRDVAALDEHVAEMASGFPDVGAAAIACDVTDQGQVEEMIAATVSRFGGVDILVNAAGVTGPIETPAQDVDPAEFRKVIEINVLGTFLPCRAAIPQLIARGPGGRIINIAGTSGLRGYRNRVGYSSSKWAVRGLTRTLALELGPHDITVNAICPNVMNGSRMETIVREKAQKTGRAEQEVYDDFAGQTALGRFVDDTDVANAMRYLVSEGARNVTGHDIAVDAGWDV
ncbi:MAG TPA: SDR family NAD(P)-dependent oxidoreductase [Solirubrobacteraceae bacterium]|jgi:3-oxoacyl-[acyl-carrier protein] reductase|nr:SDR family NAD(P)-dependent oxidoreductase [Solirubrobacteraceae bacterium]